jgi:hypothetical protein
MRCHLRSIYIPSSQYSVFTLLFWTQNSQFAVNVKSFICADFKAAHTLRAHLCVVDRRVEFVAPGAAVAVAIAVVVAE